MPSLHFLCYNSSYYDTNFNLAGILIIPLRFIILIGNGKQI